MAQLYHLVVPRKQGPIATVRSCSSKVVDRFFQTISAAAYGSRRSPGRRGDRVCVRDLAAWFRPRFSKFVVPLENRGRRESRVPTAPAVSCAKRTVIDAHEHTGSAETARLSPRNGFTAYFVLSPVSGLFCHRHCAGKSPAQLNASIAAPGPHDFAVRLGVFVRR